MPRSPPIEKMIPKSPPKPLPYVVRTSVANEKILPYRVEVSVPDSSSSSGASISKDFSQTFERVKKPKEPKKKPTKEHSSSMVPISKGTL